MTPIAPYLNQISSTCFRVVLTFDQRGFDLPKGARRTKVDLVRRLIDRYYEGHSPAEKRTALEQLTKLSGGPD